MTTDRLSSKFSDVAPTDAVQLAHRERERLGKLMINLSQAADDAFQVGLDYDHLRAPEHRAQNKDARRERERQFSTRLRALLDAQISALEERIDWLGREIATLDLQLSEISSELEDNRKRSMALEQALVAVDETGDLPVDSHPDAWMALHAYLTETGQSVDLNDAASLRQALLEAKAHEQREQDALNARHRALTAKRTRYQLELDEKTAELEDLKRQEPGAAELGMDDETQSADLFNQTPSAPTKRL